MDRIEPAIKVWYDATKPRARLSRDPLLLHLLGRHLEAAQGDQKRSGLLSVREILKKHRVEAKYYAFGRDQLEHYAKWLEGRARYTSLAPWDTGNLQGSNYTLAGRRWDVSRTSLQRLEDLVLEVADAVMREGKAELIRCEMNKGVSPLNARARLLRAAVGFTLVPADEPELRLLHRWLDSWRGIGDVVASMARQGWDLQLTEYNAERWRATFFVASQAHSIVGGSAWETTP